MRGLNFSEPLKPKMYFPHTKTQKYIFTKRQQRKNANNLGLILNEDIMEERRLVLGVEELSIQCQHPPWYQSYWLSAESVKSVSKPCPLCLKIGHG